jgi:hypothetical protein
MKMSDRKSQISLENLLMHKPATLSERELAAQILVKDSYLDKLTNVNPDEIKWLARLETMAYILDGTLPNVDAKPIKFLCKKYKRLVISKKGKGQRNIVELFRAEAKEEQKERSFKDKLLGREVKE